jgi:hypothetical protein
MANIYNPPKGLDFKCDYNGDWQKQEEDYIKRLRKYCKEHTDSKSNLVGVIFRIPYADGHAQYMVFRTKPLEMIHVPIGDAWDAPDYQTRGIRLQDIKDQVKFDKSWEELQK